MEEIKKTETRLLSINNKRHLRSLLFIREPKDKMKYQLIRSRSYLLDDSFKFINVDTEYCSINNSIITFKNEFMWNGADGIADTKRTIIASAFHDVFYRMIRKGLLDISYKGLSDKLFYNILLTLGENKTTAYIFWLGLKSFGSLFGLGKWKKIKFW